MGKTQKLIFAALIAAVFAFTFDSVFDPKLHIGGDNAWYIMLAKNIASGDGYTQMSYTGELEAASHFPPGYSAILSTFMMVGVDSIIFFKILNGLFLLASLLMLFHIADRLTGHTTLAFSATLLAVFSPQTLGFATIVMSEMSYIFFVTLAFLMLYRYSRHEDTSKFYRLPSFWLAVAAVAVSYHIRTVALAAIAGMLLFFAFRREWKQLFASLGGIVLLLLPWSLRNAAHGIDSRYFGTIMTVNPWRPEEGTISSFGELAKKMIANFDETVIKGFKEILFPFMNVDTAAGSGFLAVVGGLLILGVVLWGAWNMGKLRWLIVGYLLGNIGLFMLWHGGNGTRYVTTIAPLLFVCFYAGVYFLITKVLLKKQAAAAKYLPWAFLLMVIPMLGPVGVQAAIGKQPYAPAYTNYFTIARELDAQAPAGTVVAARKPELFMYHAGNIIAVNYLYSLDADEVLRDLLRKNVQFVVLEQLGYSSTPRYLYPAIEQNQALFPVVWHLENPDTYLLRFDREQATAKLSAETGAAE